MADEGKGKKPDIRQGARPLTQAPLPNSKEVPNSKEAASKGAGQKVTPTRSAAPKVEPKSATRHVKKDSSAKPAPGPLTGARPPAAPPAAPKPEPFNERQTNRYDFDGFGEEQAESRGERELRAVEKELKTEGPEGRGWKVALNMVNRFRPVPQLVWPMVHTVYGRPGTLGNPDPLSFSSVEKLLVRAAQDKTLTRNNPKEESELKTLGQTVQVIGADVAAAVCLVHSVCRKISTSVSEKVSKPILDDALLRTHIGFYVGLLSNRCGAGRGMIAGFAGRCGLTVQIAAGDSSQANRALSGMASGQDMSQVCTSVYGCDPLEVAALALITGGCCREIAFGISAYSTKGRDIEPDSEQFLWLTLFSVIENTRMGQLDSIPDEHWRELGYSPAQIRQLQDHVIQSQRRGHGWQWMTQQQLVAIGESLDTTRDPTGRLRRRELASAPKDEPSGNE